MLRTSSLPASGGFIPRCYGFRLKPRAVAGAAVVALPFPVTLRDQSTHQNEFQVFDPSWYERDDRELPERAAMMGPFVVDPAGLLPGWAWDVTWSDEEGERVRPDSADGDDQPLTWDSGAVAAGAAIDSDVLDLSRARELEIVVDNTLGTVFRDLVLTSYLDDGITVVDSLLLRRCCFGAKTNGADYDPGRSRILVGPSASAGDPISATLYDVTSAANNAQDTGPLLTEDADAVDAVMVPGGGVPLAAGFPAYRVLDDGTSTLYLNQNNAAAAVPSCQAFGQGGPVQANTVGTTIASGPIIFRRMRFTQGALGAGITSRLVVTARGRRPGTCAHQQALPTKARVQLAAGGAAAARLTVVRR